MAGNDDIEFSGSVSDSLGVVGTSSSPPCSPSSSIECEEMIEMLQKELDLIRLNLEDIVNKQIDEAKIENQLNKQEIDDGEHTLIVPQPLHSLRTKNQNFRRKMKQSEKEQKMSWEKQQYYIKLVNEKEREIIENRHRCMELMEKQIIHQLSKLQSTSNRLKHKLNQRVAKEKAMKLAKKQTSTAKVSQSTSTQISSHHRYAGSPYKSSFYKAIEQQCYHAKSSLKHSQQLPVKRIKSTNKIIQQTRRNNPDAYDEDDDEDDDEPSNTWAITATATVNYNDNKVKLTPVHNKQNFFVGPPVIKPISAFLGEPNKEEEHKLHVHEAKMEQLSVTQRKLRYMYRLAREHQMMSSSMNRKHNLATEWDISPRERITPLPAAKPIEPSITLQSVSSLSESPSHKSLSSPSHMLSSSPTPLTIHPSSTPLTIDSMVDNAPIIKEPKTTTIWRNYIT